MAYAIVQIAKAVELNDLERWVWVAGTVFFPLVAAIVWFVAGSHPFGLRLTRSVR